MLFLQNHADMFKKYTFLSCSGVQLLSSTSASSPLPRLKIDHGLGAPQATRNYATTSNITGHEYSWPGAPSFTPYDVFNIPQAAPYSKSRYYDLVKIYHPDRPCNEHRLCQGLSPEIRLKRYHIVVTAHEILSDPNKRAAYDQFGTGWKYGPKQYNTAAEASAEWGPYGPTIYANATWEDWERWNNRHERQQHVVDHRTFTRLVILLTLFGGAVQASWISQLQTGYEEKLREASKDSMRFLSGRREHAIDQMSSNEARVQSFLVRRDPTGAGLKEEEQPVYQKELHKPGQTSQSEAAQVPNKETHIETGQVTGVERSEGAHKTV